MLYQPSNLVTDPAALEELQRISLAFEKLQEQLGLPVRAKEYPKPRDGQIAIADGTNWDPASTGTKGPVWYDVDTQQWYAVGGGGGGTVESVVGTTNQIDVDDTDPANPVVSLATVVLSALTDASTAVQPGDLPLTTKGDIFVYSSANTRLPVGTNRKVLIADSTQTTGLKWDSVASDEVTYDHTTSGLAATTVKGAIDELAGSTSVITDWIGYFFPGKPTNSQLMSKVVFEDNYRIPGNFLGAKGHIGTNPTATTTIDVAKNGSSIGTVSISTAGVFTFTTTSGAAVDVAPGDRLTFTAQSSADTTAADFSVDIPLTAYVIGYKARTTLSVGVFFPGKPGNSQLLNKWLSPVACTIPGNLVGSYGHVGTNPTATATLTLSHNGASVGTLSISTGGVFTLTTPSGASIAVVAGDRLELSAQASADATMADIGFTLKMTL